MRIASFLLAVTGAAGWTVENPGWPGVNADNGYVLGIFPNLAYMAFPILPYELFTFLPPIYLYFLLKPTAKVTIPRIIVAVTYFGGIFGGAVHTVAFLSVLSGILNAHPGVNKDNGMCTALPQITDNRWCVLLTLHVLFAVPMYPRCDSNPAPASH